MSAEAVELCPEVAAIAAAVTFDATAQQFELPERAMTEHARRFVTELAASKRQLVAPEHARKAIAQLIVLFTLVSDAPGQELADAGVQLDGQTQALLDLEVSKLPVSAAGKVPGAYSPLGLRLNRPHGPNTDG